MIIQAKNHSIEYLETGTKSYRAPFQKQAHTALPSGMQLVRFAFNTLGRIFPEKASKIALNLFGTPRKRAKHKVRDAVMDSAKISDILVDELAIKIYEWGEGEQTVLLAHGWESRGTALRVFIPGLLEAGYKVLAFDAPGHGDSEGKQVTLITFAEVISTLIEQQQNIRAIIAHSFGGPTSIYALANLKDSIHIPKIALISTPSAISIPLNEAIELMNLPQKVAKRFTKKVEEVIQMPIQEMAVPNFSEVADIGEILVLHDQNDNVVPIASAIDLSRAFKQAQLVTTQGLGHYRILKNKQVADRVIRFVLD